MATSFKSLSTNDIVTTRTLLHEAIPITGTLVSGTYAQVGVPQRNANIKTYSHGMFQSVYDYPYLSSSANHIFDITCGVSSQSNLTVANMAAKKRNIYGQMANSLGSGPWAYVFAASAASSKMLPHREGPGPQRVWVPGPNLCVELFCC